MCINYYNLSTKNDIFMRNHISPSTIHISVLHFISKKKMNDNIKTTFIQFLKKNNAWEKYIRNLRCSYRQNYSVQTLFSLICLYPKLKRPRNFIMGDFQWSTSLEGFDYWDNLYTKWCTQIYD